MTAQIEMNVQKPITAKDKRYKNNIMTQRVTNY